METLRPGLIISNWLMPESFPLEAVPLRGLDFLKETLNEPLEEAINLAERHGWSPLLQDLPDYAADLIGFSFELDGIVVPAIARIKAVQP